MEEAEVPEMEREEVEEMRRTLCLRQRILAVPGSRVKGLDSKGSLHSEQRKQEGW